MATEKEASCPTCASDPNFAVICSFLNKFAGQCGITFPSFAELQEMLEDTQEVSQILIDMHVKLLRKARKSFTADKWEKALSKFCHTYSQQDGWELERFGYKKARLGVKVKLLKVLLETQFDVNSKFKTEVNKVTPDDLRLEPLGRDQTGLTYWCQFDPSSHVRVYREDVDDETWELVAKDRDGLVHLIDSLCNGEGQRELNNILNEDSTSQEIEKPITDTGQHEEAEDEEEEEEEEEEEDASEDELEDEDEEDEIDVKNKIKSIERLSDDSKNTDISEAKTSDNCGVQISSNTSENSLSGVDLSLKAEPRKYTANPNSQLGNFYMIPDRHPQPETADILSQMSAKFNENRDVEDLSISSSKKLKEPDSENTEITNPAKKIKLDEEEQPIMLVKKDEKLPDQSDEPISLVTESGEPNGDAIDYSPESEVGEAIEEPVQHVEGPGSGEECCTGNPRYISSTSNQLEVVESNTKCSIKPIEFQYTCDLRTDCNVGNPRLLTYKVPNSLDVEDENAQGISDPEFSDVIEEPVQYVVGCGYGADCDVGNPRRFGSIDSHEASSQSQDSSFHPEVSLAIEEPIQYVSGSGSGAECGLGSPRHTRDPSISSHSSSVATMGIECSMGSLTLQAFEPKFSDVIEEPLMFVRGSGYGQDCLTGNSDEKEDSSVEESSPEKRPKLLSDRTECVVSKEGCADSKGDFVASPKNLQNAIDLSESSKAPEDLSKETSPDICSDPKVIAEIEPCLENTSEKDKPPDCENKMVVSDICDNKIIKNEGEKKHLAEQVSNSNGIRDIDSISSSHDERSEKKLNDSSNLNSSQSLEMNDDIPHEAVANPKKDDSELFKENSQVHNVQEKDGEALSKKSEKKIDQTLSSVSIVDGRNSDPKISSQEDDCSLKKDSTNDRNNALSLKKKPKESHSALTENGPLVHENETSMAKVENLNSSDSLKDSDTNSDTNIDESTLDTKKNNTNSDKTNAQRKNVMLTNIIEVCLDNDTILKDNRCPDIKEKINAKYINLFSAKDLVTPPFKKEVLKDELLDVPKEEEKNCFSPQEEEKNCISPQEEEKNCISPQEEEKNCISPKEEICNLVINDNSPVNLKKENFEESANLEEGKDQLAPNVKIKNEIEKQGENVFNEGEIAVKEEDNTQNKIEDEKEEAKNEETQIKPAARGRKSRTNSLCNEQEVEIPNKIRKTDKIDVKPTRRSTRRSNRSNSQSGLNSVSEDEMKNKNSENNEDKSNLPQSESSKVNSNITNENSENKEETLGKKELNNEHDKLENKEEPDSTKDSSISKVPLTLSSFSMEDIPNDTPVVKNANRKRRSSMRMSRSEEEGAEQKEEEEEAGGKKPRLRGKARRGRGRGSAPISRPPPEASSSDEEEESTEKIDDKKETGASKGRGQGKSRGRGKRAVGKAKNNSSTTESKKKKPPKSKNEEKSEEDTVKETKKQNPSKKSTKSTKKEKEDHRKKEETEEKKNESDSESGNKKTKGARSRKQVKKSSSKIPLKQRKTPKDEKESDDEEEEEEEGDEDDEEEEETDEMNTKSKEKDSKIKEKDTKPKAKDGKSKEKDANEVRSKDSSDKDGEDEHEPEPQKEQKPKKPRTPKKKTLLGLMESDLIHSKPTNASTDEGGSRVRQSRRIAQIKIKEEAERRAIEEATILSIKEMKKPKKEEKQATSKKTKKKKGKSEMGSEDEDETFKEPFSEDKKRGRKKKKRKDRLKYDENRPWQSSSNSSSEEAEEEDEHFDEEDDEDDIRTKQLVSDHEFSPESDLENEDEEGSAVPIRRARTAKKDVEAENDAEEAEEEPSEDYPCKKCGQPNHPEWILLCDKCDSGYHASCLRPPLMLIPEGDWFCPPCQHADLVNKLKETLRAFEKNTKKRENEELRRKRLAYVGISLANVLPNNEKPSRRPKSSSEYSSSEEEESESESSEEEPVYQLRQRRTACQANYRFNDYDDLINSAIQDEMEAVKGAGNMGRGKDIANIVEAEKGDAVEGSAEAENPAPENGPLDEEEEEGENWRPRVVPRNTALPSLRKKPKKLTDLDRASDDDADSDEDFKGSSEEEEYSSTEGDTGDSEARVPIRRSSRHRISRIDKEFINDDSESSDEPRRKKTRKLYASSSSESSDSTWGRRKRKTTMKTSYSRISSSRGGKKKKKNYFDSDSDKPKKVKTKRPKIKYGLSEDDEDDLGPIRRTRGKKVSYLDVAGSDTEEEVIRRSRKLPSEDEDEFIPEKEGGDEEECDVEEEELDMKGANNDDDDDEDDSADEEKADKERESSNEAVRKKVEEKVEKGPAVIVEAVRSAEAVDDSKVSDREDVEEEEDDVEEEEIEEEIEEEVEEEEEDEIEEKVEEAKNLAIPKHLPKLRIVDTRELMRKEPVEEKKTPQVTITVVNAKPGLGAKPLGGQAPPVGGLQLSGSAPPATGPSLPTSAPTPVIKLEDKKEEKEERKEPVPTIRLVPSAKLLDPNKQRRPPDESLMIRGMLAGGGYYRPQRIPQPPPPQYRQRYQEQQRYAMYQPPPPPPSHQYYPTGGYYPSEEYGGYDEHMEQQVTGAGGDEDGVFSGLVSYFSSQREDNLDS